MKRILANQKIIIAKIKRTDEDVRRLDRRTKPQRSGGLWNWAKDTAAGIFHVGSHTITISTLFSGITAIQASLAALSTQVTEEIGASDELLGKEIIDSKDSVEDTIDRMEASTSQHIERSEEIITDRIKVSRKQIVDYVPDAVSNRVVGMSYFAWDSQRSYHPTIAFIFLEETDDKYKRRTEIQARLPIKPNQFTPKYRAELVERLDAGGPSFKYYRGPSRYFYVDSQKRWKTTVYCANSSEGEKAVREVCGFINENFDYTQGSFTAKFERVRINNYNASVTKIPKNPIDYKDYFQVKLFRVSVLLQGAVSPITVYPVVVPPGPQIGSDI